MGKELTQRLWEVFPPEDKGDFFDIYMYLKHIDHFIYKGLQNMGLASSKTPATEIDEEISEMLDYILQGVAENAGSRDTSIYHGKVVKLKDALQLVTREQDISLDPPETVVPYKQARKIILQNPTSLAVGVCPCRSVAENPCLAPDEMEVCMFVGDPGAAFIAEFNPLFRQINQEEAINILEDCHNRGFVHCAYFKKDFARRFVAICNCCSCCCLGMKSWNLFGEDVPILAPSGYVAEVGDECMGCGDCVSACGFFALSMDEERQIAVVDKLKCMGCGVCEDKCPAGAISLRLDASKGRPLDLAELMKQA